MHSRPIVIDANILVRSVLCERVSNIIIEQDLTRKYFISDDCVVDARKYLPMLFEKRN